MKGLFLVEPVVALYAFSSFLIYPLVQQYVYRQLWQQLTNSTYPISDNASRCTQESNNQSSIHEVSLESMGEKSIYLISQRTRGTLSYKYLKRIQGISNNKKCYMHRFSLFFPDCLCLGNNWCLCLLYICPPFAVMTQHRFNLKSFRLSLSDSSGKKKPCHKLICRGNFSVLNLYRH